MKMDMNKEIKKYQGRIYFYDRSEHNIQKADWIESIDDYNHYSYQLHHVVPYTDWEGVNKKKDGKNLPPKYSEMPEHNALILLPKQMHQHLENPMYKLSKPDFEKFYGIHPDEILFDIHSRLPRERELFYSQTLCCTEADIKETVLHNCLKSSQNYSTASFSYLTMDDLTDEDINLLPNKGGVVCQN